MMCKMYTTVHTHIHSGVITMLTQVTYEISGIFTLYFLILLKLFFTINYCLIRTKNIIHFWKKLIFHSKLQKLWDPNNLPVLLSLSAPSSFPAPLLILEGPPFFLCISARNPHNTV